MQRMASILAFLFIGTNACMTTPPATTATGTPVPASSLNEVAEQYVKLVLAVGKHDPDYVDAYYGPPAWRVEADSARLTLPEIAARVASVSARLGNVLVSGDDLERLRHSYLRTQLRAVGARVEMLQGKKLTFDEESRALYAAVAPTHPESYFQQIVDSLGVLLPGAGTVQERYERYRSRFAIPAAQRDTVFRTAIAECKTRTQRYITLPPGENFKLEFVTGKSWSGYNWYQGNYQSLIQVNTDLPIHIDRAVDLACHEGYPGHHAYNALLEHQLVKQRGWVEYTVYPLFSPQSLIAEGSANYGIDMAFPGAERAEYEKRALWPLAGLDPAEADRYYRVLEVSSRLSYAGNEAARKYLNGEINAQQAADWLTRYTLNSPARAQQRVRFIDQYRSYVINYNLGKDIVRAYVERVGGSDQARRWAAFTAILTSPRLPGDLR
jgi:hypothetical protein